MTKAAITPGTQPANVSKNTISTEPHPLSSIDNGGNIIAKSALKKDIKPTNNSSDKDIKKDDRTKICRLHAERTGFEPVIRF